MFTSGFGGRIGIEYITICHMLYTIWVESWLFLCLFLLVYIAVIDLLERLFELGAYGHMKAVDFSTDHLSGRLSVDLYRSSQDDGY